MEFISQLAGYEVSYAELLAVLFGFINVWLNIRQNVWAWPAGLVSVSLFLVVFFDARLYADVVLQGVYVLLSLYGWYNWLHGGSDGGTLSVSRVSPRAAAALTVLAVFGAAVLGGLFSRFTDADLPYLNSLTTALSLAGTWMLTKKILENWIVWIVADTIYVGMYAYKGLYFTTALFAVYLVLATRGYFAWRQTMKPAAAQPA